LKRSLASVNYLVRSFNLSLTPVLTRDAIWEFRRAVAADASAAILTDRNGLCGVVIAYPKSLQRLLLGETGMGLLFLLTGGLFFMRTILDLATYKTLAFSYNQRVAQRILTEISKLISLRAQHPLVTTVGSPLR
jgi:hypothetical protein